MTNTDSWRIHVEDAGKVTDLKGIEGFDELVVGDWFHLERMDKNVWWARVGDARLIVTIASNGETKVDIERGTYGKIIDLNK